MRTGSLNLIAYGRFKDIQVYIVQSFELDTIAAHARLAKRLAIGLAK